MTNNHEPKTHAEDIAAKVDQAALTKKFKCSCGAGCRIRYKHLVGAEGAQYVQHLCGHAEAPKILIAGDLIGMDVWSSDRWIEVRKFS